MANEEKQNACYAASRKLYQALRRKLTQDVLAGKQTIDIVEADRIWKLVESGYVFQQYDQKALEGVEALIKLLPTAADISRDLNAMQQFSQLTP